METIFIHGLRATYTKATYNLRVVRVADQLTGRASEIIVDTECYPKDHHDFWYGFMRDDKTYDLNMVYTRDKCYVRIYAVDEATDQMIPDKWQQLNVKIE